MKYAFLAQGSAEPYADTDSDGEWTSVLVVAEDSRGAIIAAFDKLKSDHGCEAQIIRLTQSVKQE